MSSNTASTRSSTNHSVGAQPLPKTTSRQNKAHDVSPRKVFEDHFSVRRGRGDEKRAGSRGWRKPTAAAKTELMGELREKTRDLPRIAVAKQSGRSTTAARSTSGHAFAGLAKLISAFSGGAVALQPQVYLSRGTRNPIRCHHESHGKKRLGVRI